MKIMKLILWPILVFCCVWVSAIFFFSFLITNAASYFSDGRVILKRVKVSPKLKINAAVVDFAQPGMFGGKDLRVSSRAVSVDWRITDGFKLIGIIGPSSLKEYGTVGSANFSLKPNSLIDWSEVYLNLEFKQFIGANFEVLAGAFKGKITEHFKVFRDFSFVASRTLGEIANNPFRADAWSTSADRYKIGQPLTLQNMGTNFGAKRLMFTKGGLGSSSVKGEIKLSKGVAEFKVSVSSLHLDQYDLKAENLTITSKHSILSDAFEGAGEFSISDIVSQVPAINIENYNGSYQISSSDISHIGTALISDLEVKTDQYFIGQIKNAILNVNLDGLTASSGIDLKGEGILSLKDVAGFNVNVFVESSLSEDSFFHCFEHRCSLDPLEVKYDISASGSVLTGNLKCGKVDCLTRPLLHVIRTDDTNKFFQALSSTGILSPLSLPIAFLAVSGGEVSGNGHVLNF